MEQYMAADTTTMRIPLLKTEGSEDEESPQETSFRPPALKRRRSIMSSTTFSNPLRERLFGGASSTMMYRRYGSSQGPAIKHLQSDGCSAMTRHIRNGSPPDMEGKRSHSLYGSLLSEGRTRSFTLGDAPSLLDVNSLEAPRRFSRTVRLIKTGGDGSTERVAPRRSRSRKFSVVEIFAGMIRRHLIQTPELMRRVHYHNKAKELEDTKPGSLKLRDLRQVCFASPGGGHRPSLEPRRNCILINLPRLRCVILHDRVLVIPPNGDADSEEFTESTFYPKIIEKLLHLSEMKAMAGPFEFAALEAILVEEVSDLSSSLTPLKDATDKLIHFIRRNPTSSNKLHEITDLKRHLDGLLDKVKGCGLALQEVLDNEEDVRRLEISRFWDYPEEWENPLDTSNAEEVEILLECYEQEIESIAKQLNRMDEDMDDAIQIMQLHLSSIRNAFLKAELGLDIVGVVITMVGAVAGIFGMNIPNGFEDTPWMFWPLTHVLLGICAATGVGVVFLFRRLQL